MPKQPQVIEIFDRRLVRRHRNRAAARFAEHDFLFRWTIDNLGDRLRDVKRDFGKALLIGARGREISSGLLPGKTVTLDIAEELLQPPRPATSKAQAPNSLHPSPHNAPEAAKLRGRDGSRDFVASSQKWGERLGGGANAAIIAEEEFLPFADNSFDLVFSPLTLHSVNDLPGALIQINRVLRPDGLFLGAMLGGETLFQLRQVMMEAEMTIKGGASPHIAPFADKPQTGALLQRAGFALPVVDSEIITVTYGDIFKLMHDLRGMGESNSLKDRRKQPLGKTLFMETARLYQERFAEADGRIAASFEVIFMIGWAPHASQQKPLRPGSAQQRLADALETDEVKTGIKTGGA